MFAGMVRPPPRSYVDWAIAGRFRTSKPASFSRRWPTRSSTWIRCITTTAQAVCLSSARVTRVELYHSITRWRLTSDSASPRLEWVIDDDEIAASGSPRWRWHSALRERGVNFVVCVAPSYHCWSLRPLSIYTHKKRPTFQLAFLALDEGDQYLPIPGPPQR